MTDTAEHHDGPGRELGLTWVPTSHYRRLVTVALLPLLAAVVLGHPGYLVLAAPMVAALALAASRPGYGARVSVRSSGDRCFEGEQVTVQVSARPAGPAARPVSSSCCHQTSRSVAARWPSSCRGAVALPRRSGG